MLCRDVYKRQGFNIFSSTSCFLAPSRVHSYQSQVDVFSAMLLGLHNLLLKVGWSLNHWICTIVGPGTVQLWFCWLSGIERKATGVDVGPRFYAPCLPCGFPTFSSALDFATLLGLPLACRWEMSNVQCPMLLMLAATDGEWINSHYQSTDTVDHCSDWRFWFFILSGSVQFWNRKMCIRDRFVTENMPSLKYWKISVI